MKIRDRIKELRRVPAGELLPNPKNWRTHPKAQQDALRGVLAEVGIADALLVRETPAVLQLIDGHLRADTSPDTLWPCLILDVDDAEADKLLATVDPLAAMAETDAAKLDALLHEIDTGSEALQEMLAELAKESGLYKTPEIVEDEVPEPPADPVTKPGDLWLLGEHRLLCGDSTNAEDMRRVLDGAKAACIFTDPPYGVSVGAKNRLLNSFQKAGRNLTDIIDDDLTPEELEATLLAAFINCRQVAMAEDCTLFVSSPQGCGLSMMMMMMMMMQKAGLKARHVLIWVKNQPTFSMGRLDYDYQHEPILLTWLKRHKRPMGGEHRTSVWKIDKPRKSAEHPTMKPVELYANAYLNNSDAGDNVFDMYSGSGTAFIAAEQLGRRCYGLELEPKYCDVICQRWSMLTGRVPTREDGTSFTTVEVANA
jgi:DNA modification methylase